MEMIRVAPLQCARPAKIPIVAEMDTATAIRLSVSMAESHMPAKPQNITAETQNNASRRPPHHSVAKPTASTDTGHGINSKESSTQSRPSPIAPAIALVNQR